MLHVDIKAALLYNVMDDEGSNDEIKEDEQLCVTQHTLHPFCNSYIPLIVLDIQICLFDPLCGFHTH